MSANRNGPGGKHLFVPGKETQNRFLTPTPVACTHTIGYAERGDEEEERSSLGDHDDTPFLRDLRSCEVSHAGDEKTSWLGLPIDPKNERWLLIIASRRKHVALVS